MESYLKSVVPEFRERGLTYDLDPGATVPGEDDYLVSIGSKTDKAGTVYLVLSCREVMARKPRPFVRYALRVARAPDLVPLVEIRPGPNGKEVWIKDQQCFPIFWYSRDKKQ